MNWPGLMVGGSLIALGLYTVSSGGIVLLLAVAWVVMRG